LLETPYGTISSQAKSNASFKKEKLMKKIIPKSYETKYDYYATEDGQIYSSVSKKYLKPFSDKDGYLRVRIVLSDGTRKSAPVHRLVLMAFNPVESMELLQTNHKNSCRTDNSLQNLEWCTSQENVYHSITQGYRRTSGEDNFFSEHKEKEIIEILDLIYFTNIPYSEIAAWYNYSSGSIEQIARGKRFEKIKRPSKMKTFRRQNEEEQILEVIDLLQNSTMTQKQIAEKCNVSVSVVSRVKRKETWKHLTRGIVF
jgi:hypothetical protein